MKNCRKYMFALFFVFWPFLLSAQSQFEMNMTANQNYIKADKSLNKVYKKLMLLLNTDEKKLLVKAQKEWLKYRDSDCDFEKEGYDGGSMQPMVYYDCLKSKTLARTKDLKRLLEFYTDKY